MSSSVVVRVANSSKLVLTGCSALRAVNIDEMERLVDDSNCKLLIIEGIKQGEYDRTKEVIQKTSGRIVTMFYIPKNDDYTSGLADELEYPIYLNKEDLFLGVYKKTGLKIGNSLDTIKKIKEIEENNSPFDSESLFDDVDSKEISDTVEDEIKAVKTKDETGHEDEVVPVKIIKDMQEDNEELVKAIEEANSKIESLTRLNSELLSQRDNAVNMYAELVKDETVIVNPISREEYKDLEDSIANLKKKLETAETELESRGSEIDTLRSEISNKEIEVADLRKKIESGEINRDKIDELEDKLSKANEEIGKLAGLLKQKEVELKEYEDRTVKELNGKREEINRLNGEVSRLITELSNSEREKEVLKADGEKKVSDIESELNRANEEIESLKLSKDTDIKLAVSRVERELDGERENHRHTSDELRSVSQQLESVSDKYNKLVRLGGDNIEAVVAKRDELEETNKRLSSKLIETSSKLETSEKAYNELADRANELIGNLNTYKKALKERAKSGNSDANEIMEIKYSGRAKIIGVLGRGSYGISTTALSIAESLSDSSKTCYIDMDLISPNVDSFFEMSPYFKVNGANMTSLKVFIELGVDKMVNERALVSGKVKYDIITGIYTRDNVKIVSTDFSELFNKLGGIYDYIVVDLGKTGCSAITDSIIKEVCKIADRVVAVSVRGAINVSKIVKKISRLSIEPSKTLCMFNMSEDETLNDREIGQLGRYNSAVIPFEYSLYGKRRTYKAVPLIKSRFTTVMNFILS